MAAPAALDRLRTAARPLLRPLKRLLETASLARLWWAYWTDGIDGVAIELRKLRSGHARALRAFGARVAEGAVIAGPLTIVNARRDFSNLEVGPGAHVGQEVFIDLADRVVIGEPFTLPAARRITSEVVHAATEEIMRRIAALLPPAYRGIYQESASLTNEGRAAVAQRSEG